ncbi:MAG: DUF2442 domain-containing protein [Sphingobacteriales bacterium]|nr:MAG: DUF2442 domain-containing protein [Sphingobacteriales bacterium]
MKLIKVTEAKYIKDYIISFDFNDGTYGSVDFSDLLKGEVFEPLKDKEVFKNFSLNPWTIEWENGADLAPEFLYELAKQSGISKSVA